MGTRVENWLGRACSFVEKLLQVSLSKDGMHANIRVSGPLPNPEDTAMSLVLKGGPLFWGLGFIESSYGKGTHAGGLSGSGREDSRA